MFGSRRQPGWAMTQDGQMQQTMNAVTPEQAFREYDGFCQRYQGDPQAEFEEKCRQMGLTAQQRQAVLQAAGRFAQIAGRIKR